MSVSRFPEWGVGVRRKGHMYVAYKGPSYSEVPETSRRTEPVESALSIDIVVQGSSTFSSHPTSCSPVTRQTQYGPETGNTVSIQDSRSERGARKATDAGIGVTWHRVALGSDVHCPGTPRGRSMRQRRAIKGPLVPEKRGVLYRSATSMCGPYPGPLSFLLSIVGG